MDITKPNCLLRAVFLAVTVFLCPFFAHAQVLELHELQTPRADLSDFTFFLTDSTNRYDRLSLNEIPDSVFRPLSEAGTLLSGQNHIFRCRIINRTGRDADFIFSAGGRYNSSVIFEEKFTNGRTKTRKSGSNLPVSEKDLNFWQGRQLMKLFLQKNEERTISFKIRNDNGKPADTDFFIFGTEQLRDSVLEQYLIQGLFQGAFILLILYNLSFFLISERKSYLPYIAYLVCLSTYFLNYYGFTTILFFPENPGLYSTVYLLSTGGIGIFHILFFRSFLNTPVNYPKTDVILLFWLIFRLIFSTVLFFVNLNGNFAQVHDLNKLFAQAESGFLILLVIVTFRKNNFAYWYMAAGTLSLQTGLVLSIWAANSWSMYVRGNYIFQAGAVLEVFCFSLGLGYRMRLSDIARRKAQDRLISLQKDQAHSLEKKVKDRTAELEESNSELMVSKKELLQQTEELKATNSSLKTTLIQLKTTQAQLIESEKLAGLGVMAAGVMHEINNPLNFITGGIQAIEILMEDMDEMLHLYENINMENSAEMLVKIAEKAEEIDYEELKKSMPLILNDIRQGAGRTEKILAALRTFSRLDMAEEDYFQMEKMMESVVILAGKPVGKNIRTERHYEDNLPVFHGHAGQINQLIFNILHNAAEAIEKEGLITIHIGFEPSASELFIRISDTGRGIPEDISARIFEPFFTTKAVGSGQGLGLAVAHGCMNAHNGRIEVQSEVEKGSTFSLYFPIKDA